MNKLAVIVLAAGKGKRMNSKHINKVVLKLGGRQMILRTIDLLENLKISPIIVVVGFAKKSVTDLLGQRVVFVDQKKRLGTAHAVKCALKYLPRHVTDVLVLNGDDSAFYEGETIINLIKVHQKKNTEVTFLTIELDNPSGLGRIIRDDKEQLLAIIEDKDASLQQKKIEEINPGCYLFKVSFLRKYLRKIKKSKTTDEYYLTRLVDIAAANNEKIETLRGGKIPWRGINTPLELKEAERFYFQHSTSEESLRNTSEVTEWAPPR
ncbi:MAG: NTP transferase domain-containing protein [Patescibacteria group bacterium]